MNQATRASQNLIKDLIWPAGRTLDMPDLGDAVYYILCGHPYYMMGPFFSQKSLLSYL